MLLVSAGPTAAAGQPPADPGRPLAFTLPGLAWTLEVHAPGFVVGRDEIRADGGVRYVYAVNAATDVVLSIRLERSAPGRTPAGCRGAAWAALRQRSPLRMTAVTTTEVGPLAILEYVVPEHEGLPVGQKHRHAYLGREDVRAEVHLSKVRFAPADGALFDAIIRRVTVRSRAAL